MGADGKTADFQRLALITHFSVLKTVCAAEGLKTLAAKCAVSLLRCHARAPDSTRLASPYTPIAHPQTTHYASALLIILSTSDFVLSH